MGDKTFSFYPVNNGQSALITLDDSTHLLFDIKQKSDGDEDEKTTDVHAELLRLLPKRDGRRRLSVFCLSHADRDHCQGFERVFYTPSRENDEDKTLIGIDELWVTAALFEDDCQDSAKVVQKEARRRLKLWIDPKKADEACTAGNRLVVFGNFDKHEDLDKLPDSQRRGAGETYDRICGTARADFELFVHSPFKYILEEGGEDRNDSSLITQVVMRTEKVTAYLLIGGDACCAVWRSVYNQTKKKKNLERLAWDVFFLPHHGSYTFFTDKTGEEGRKEAKENPASTSMGILQQGRDKGFVVCSSRPVKAENYDDDQPPHIEAICHHKDAAKRIGGKFVCLMQNPDESAPMPFILRLTDGGLQDKTDKVSAESVIASTVGATKRWG